MLHIQQTQSEQELLDAWAVLGMTFTPPLWIKMGDDYKEYAAKVAAHAVTLLAKDGDEVCGGISLYANDTQTHRAFVTMLMVAPSRQRQGLGTRLLAAAEEHSRQAGMQSIGLEVHDDNPNAKRLYEKNGYRACGRTPNGDLMQKTL